MGDERGRLLPKLNLRNLLQHPHSCLTLVAFNYLNGLSAAHSMSIAMMYRHNCILKLLIDFHCKYTQSNLLQLGDMDMFIVRLIDRSAR